MKRFAIIDTPGDITFEIHAAGCADLAHGRKRFEAVEEVEAEDVRQVAESLIDDELREMGYTVADHVRILPCALGGPAMNKREWRLPGEKVRTPKGKTMTYRQYLGLHRAQLARSWWGDGPECENGHWDCACWYRGPCSNEIAGSLGIEQEEEE